MGSVTYNFLADSIFFHKNSIENNFANESDSRIEKELQDYRNHCINNYEELIKEIIERDSFLKVFSSSNQTPLNLLKQTSLYVDQFIIKDPLFSLTDIKSDISNITAKYLGYQNNEKINRDNLKKASLFLKDITPMVAGNYVKIFPLSYHFEVPKEIPITLPVDYYNGVLPKEIMEFFRENVQVSSMEKLKSGEGWQIMEGQLYPCRSIVVDFKEADYQASIIYHLFQTEVLDFDIKTRKATFSQTLPDTAPEINEFNAWVTQSINSTSKHFFDKVFKENFISSNLNSTYLCDNDFTGKLISQNYNLKETIQTETATRLINFDLPFLENIDIEKLMTVREMESDVFTNFRIELEKHFRELRLLSDPKIIKQKTENIFHELNEVQVQKIKQKIDYINKQVFVNSLVGIGGLAGGFSTGGFSLLATALALGKGYKDYVDYKEKVKENPSYLLWKIRKK
ncbi:hypothetical protein [Elizabethkingia anophelis]|uniref:hypothetical protein n=1 Tax=Elizabethkingia anophelis TaxID=1117645 RepID=UPI0020B4168D|nr:hypothetical protein [Elizabethkingia anophelis]UTF96836.1 hypothetical protein J2N94_00700 [Elizabethkingia anophelis]